MCNCKFKKKVLRLLGRLDERTERMSEIIDSLVVDYKKALADIGSALDNIAADEQRLADQITILAQQIADLIAAGGTLGAADLEALSTFRNDLVATAARTKQIADAQPDPVPAG